MQKNVTTNFDQHNNLLIIIYNTANIKYSYKNKDEYNFVLYRKKKFTIKKVFSVHNYNYICNDFCKLARSRKTVIGWKGYIILIYLLLLKKQNTYL